MDCLSESKPELPDGVFCVAGFLLPLHAFSGKVFVARSGARKFVGMNVDEGGTAIQVSTGDTIFAGTAF